MKIKTHYSIGDKFKHKVSGDPVMLSQVDHGVVTLINLKTGNRYSGYFSPNKVRKIRRMEIKHIHWFKDLDERIKISYEDNNQEL